MNPQEIGRIATETPDKPAAPAIKNPLAVMQPGEEVICEIKRHPIGIILIYLAVGFLLVLLLGLTLVLAPSTLPNSSNSQVASLSAAVFIISAMLATGFLFIVSKIYWGNRWVITSDSITQISQTSLFHKESSQLSVEDLEDCTAEQNGILTHIFDYGVLKAETAAQRGRFIFTYCPKPVYYAQKILEVTEKYTEEHK